MKADIKIKSMKTMIPPKDPIKEPEIRSQKELNCWQMANQLALMFPLCARYTMAAAAEAADVNRASIACSNKRWLIFIENLKWKKNDY